MFGSINPFESWYNEDLYKTLSQTAPKGINHFELNELISKEKIKRIQLKIKLEEAKLRDPDFIGILDSIIDKALKISKENKLEAVIIPKTIEEDKYEFIITFKHLSPPPEYKPVFRLL